MEPLPGVRIWLPLHFLPLPMTFAGRSPMLASSLSASTRFVLVLVRNAR